MHHVLNWIAQGSVLAIAASVALGGLRRSRAQARYLLCWGAILAVLSLPILPILAITVAVPPAPGSPHPPGTLVAPPLIVPPAWWNSTTCVALLWGAWTAVCGIRIAADLRALRRARTVCAPFPVARESGLRCWMAVRADGRPARLVLSPDVGPAAVLSAGRPLIAVAPALLDRMTDDEIDRVVVHEWAHVQRRDDWLNLLHAAVQAMAGWHPAIWWLQRQAIRERESACDERAVAITGSPRRYAASLVTVAGLRTQPRRTLAAAGMLSSSSLGARVTRILATSQLASRRQSALAAVTIVAFLAASAAWLVRFPVTAAASPASALTRALATPPGTATPGDTATASAGRAPANANAAERRDPLGPQAPPVAGSPTRQAAPQHRATQLPPDLRGPAPVTLESGAPPAPADTSGSVPPPAPLSELPARAAVFPSPPPEVPSTVAEIVTPAAQAGGADAAPWDVAADAGMAVARGSRKAATATSGFFTRLGNRIGSSF